MIWYKSSIQERSSPLGAKMGRGSPVCQQIREKIIEMFKNNVPQRKIGRDLDISPSTVHNIIKRFKESGGISVRKGQGRKPKLNNRDLRSLRRHCIKNPHSLNSLHPARHLFTPLPSGRRLRAIKTKSTRFLNSTYCRIVHALNSSGVYASVFHSL